MNKDHSIVENKLICHINYKKLSSNIQHLLQGEELSQRLSMWPWLS